MKTIQTLIEDLRIGKAPDFKVLIAIREGKREVRFAPYSIRWEHDAVIIEAERNSKVCPECNESLCLSEFGIDRARKDGLNSHCRNCICARANSNRRRRQAIARKSCAPVRPVWRLRLPTKDAVLMAIKRGAKTQDEIQRATRLYPDELTDALADLYSDNKLNREALKRREYRIAA